MPSRQGAPNSTITLAEAAEHLGVHYMTAYRYVRTGRLAATKHGAEWRVKPGDLEALRPAEGRRTRPRADYTSRLESRLLAGDEAGAWSVIESAMTAGSEPERIHVELLCPALHSIGERWARGEVDIAQEHQASALALRLVGRLGPRFARRGRKRGTLLLGAAPLDDHGLPVALLADLLRGRGFEVVDLGANVPPDSFADAAIRIPRLVGIGICATSPGNDANIDAAIRALRVVTSAPILVGGAGVEPHEFDPAWEVLCCTRDPLEAIEGFERMTSAN
jgi:MerR family transcriptional regulator, light-induced transcriptional regulator